VTIINNNYHYDAARYQPHVARFYGYQSPYWGNHWRYGYYPSPVLSVGVSVGVGAGFGFGFYAYTPFYAPVVASPFYYDPYVPPYVPEARVVVWPNYTVVWDDGPVYEYIPTRHYYEYGDPELNYGIGALALIYRDRNVNVVADLTGSGDIGIFADGHYQYSVNSTDFRQMMVDDCRATPTVSYDLVSVRHRGPIAIVKYRHRFRLHDGAVGVEYQTYHLTRAGDRYAITDFMTDRVI